MVIPTKAPPLMRAKMKTAGAMVAGLRVVQLAAACDYEDPVVPDADTCAPPLASKTPTPPEPYVRLAAAAWGYALT